jgi:hypothetical protein
MKRTEGSLRQKARKLGIGLGHHRRTQTVKCDTRVKSNFLLLKRRIDGGALRTTCLYQQRRRRHF